MKSLRYLAALVFIFSITGVASRALATQAVAVTNSTAYTLTAFYASPSENSSWDMGDNLLEGQTLAPGQTSNITIPGHECNYDLMGILYGAAQYAYQYQINACGGGTWNISVPY